MPCAIADDSNSSVEFNGIKGYVEWDPSLSISGVSYFGGALMCSSVFTVEAWVREKKAPRADTFLTTCTGGAKFSFDFKFDTFTTDAIPLPQGAEARVPPQFFSASPHFFCNSGSFFLLEGSEDKSVPAKRRTPKSKKGS